MLSAEDDAGDTIRPRLDSHRADCSRIHLLKGVRKVDKRGERSEHVVTLADLNEIETALASLPDCRLIVIDPIGSYLGGRVDAHRDNEVRSVLAPIAQLAERYGVAVVVVAHRRKSVGDSADDTAMGSRAFTGIARTVWHLSRDPRDKARRLLLPGKNNLAAEAEGLAFHIAGKPAALQWEPDPVRMNADEGLAAERDSGRDDATPALDEAKDWLVEALCDGSRPAKELLAEASGDGISAGTLRRAKDALHVVSSRIGFGPNGVWCWAMPDGQASPPHNVAQVLRP